MDIFLTLIKSWMSIDALNFIARLFVSRHVDLVE